MVVRSQVGGACPSAYPADGVRNRAAGKSDESPKDRRRYSKFEDRKPSRGRVDPEAHHEPHDASHQARRTRTYRRPFRNQRPCAEGLTTHLPDGSSTPARGRKVRMKIRATMLMLVVAIYAGVIMGGPRSVVLPAAAHTVAVRLAARQPEGAFSRSSTVATQPSSSPCTGCTAIRLKLAALTLLAGFTLFVGGFVLLGRRTASNRRKAEAAKVRDG